MQKSKAKRELIRDSEEECWAIRPWKATELYTIRINYPIVDFGMVERMFLNGEEKDIKGLRKWSFILEVGHEPRIEVEHPVARKDRGKL